MAKAGAWEIEVSKGGYPAWCFVRIYGVEIARVNHRDLRDLEYVVQKAMREARESLRKNYRDEV